MSFVLIDADNRIQAVSAHARVEVPSGWTLLDWTEGRTVHIGQVLSVEDTHQDFTIGVDHRFGGGSLTIEYGQNSNAPRITNGSLVAERRHLGRIRLYVSDGSVDMQFKDRGNHAVGGPNHDLTTFFETRGEMIIRVQNGSVDDTLTVYMGDHSDDAEPYAFTPANAAEVSAFATRHQGIWTQSATTVTLTLGIRQASGGRKALSFWSPPRDTVGPARLQEARARLHDLWWHWHSQHLGQIKTTAVSGLAAREYGDVEKQAQEWLAYGWFACNDGEDGSDALEAVAHVEHELNPAKLHRLGAGLLSLETFGDHSVASDASAMTVNNTTIRITPPGGTGNLPGDEFYGPNGEGRRFESLVIFKATGQVILNLTDSSSTSGAGQELDPQIERFLRIDIRIGNVAVTIRLRTDFTEPYNFVPSNAAALVSTFGSLTSAARSVIRFQDLRLPETIWADRHRARQLWTYEGGSVLNDQLIATVPSGNWGQYSTIEGKFKDGDWS